MKQHHTVFIEWDTCVPLLGTIELNMEVIDSHDAALKAGTEIARLLTESKGGIVLNIDAGSPDDGVICWEESCPCWPIPR